MVFGAALFLLSNVVADVYTLMLNFTSGGFFLSFLFPLIGFLVIKLRGRWKDGPFSLGRGTTVVAVIAVVWAVFEFLNIAWPRPFFEAEFLNWSIWIAMGVLGLVGAVIYLALRKNIPVVTGLDFVMSEDLPAQKSAVTS
jgi:amino acid transporter